MTDQAPHQYTLPLQLGPLSTDEQSFIVQPCNREAVAWLDRPSLWPGRSLVLFGPAGCGKTHLAKRFLARVGGQMVATADLVARLASDIAAEWPALCVDDADEAARAGAEAPLFHLFNTMRDLERPLLFTAKEPPARWSLALADLRSRLVACATVGIAVPDDRLLADLLAKQFRDRQLRVDPAVLSYAVPRMERSFGAVRDLVQRIDDLALRTGRPVTVPLVRSILARSVAAEDPQSAA